MVVTVGRITSLPYESLEAETFRHDKSRVLYAKREGSERGLHTRWSGFKAMSPKLVEAWDRELIGKNTNDIRSLEAFLKYTGPSRLYIAKSK